MNNVNKTYSCCTSQLLLSLWKIFTNKRVYLIASCTLR